MFGQINIGDCLCFYAERFDICSFTDCQIKSRQAEIIGVVESKQGKSNDAKYDGRNAANSHPKQLPSCFHLLDAPDFQFIQAAVEMAGSIGRETRTTPDWPDCGG